MEYYANSPFLQHYGVLGMRWGVRRYRNADGSLTDAGKKHYARGIAKGGFKKDRLDTMSFFMDNGQGGMNIARTHSHMIDRALRRDTARAKQEGITERALMTARYEVASDRVQRRAIALAVTAPATVVGTAALAAMSPILAMPVATLGATASMILGKNVLYYHKERETYKPRG